MIRNIDSINNSIEDTFAYMRISTKQKLVGSSSGIGNIITNDYDLNELVKEHGNEEMILYKIYKIFRSKFVEIHKTRDRWIVDFKCGELLGEPIRWNMHDIKNKSVEFMKCILQKSTIKMDIVQFINGKFVEISEVYYFNINGKINYHEDEFDLPYIIHALETDRNELIRDGNIFKALKREYRILELLDKNKKRRNKLQEIFNGVFGYLYYAISQLKTLIIMKEQSFRRCPIDIYRTVQQTIKDDIGKVINYSYANKILDGNATVTQLEKIVEYLEDKILNTKISRINI
jgi:hypothetical protein